jgi:hypothetical protein
MVDANSGEIPVRSPTETVAAWPRPSPAYRRASVPLAPARAARSARWRFRWEAKARVLNTTYQRLAGAS